MGVRLHKILGYGLSDVVTDDGDLADPRINAAAPVLTGETDESQGIGAYLSFLEVAGARDGVSTGLERGTIVRGVEAGRAFDYLPERSVVHRSEGGLPSVLCVKPVSMRDWARMEDSIDWVMETHVLNRNGTSSVQPLPSGPYPWGGLFMDDRTGARVDQAIIWWVRERQDPAADLMTLDELAAAGGFADHADAAAHCAPWIPTEVRLLCEFAGVFNDPATVNQLRPMLYTYWA